MQINSIAAFSRVCNILQNDIIPMQFLSFFLDIMNSWEINVGSYITCKLTREKVRQESYLCVLLCECEGEWEWECLVVLRLSLDCFRNLAQRRKGAVPVCQVDTNLPTTSFPHTHSAPAAGIGGLTRQPGGLIALDRCCKPHVCSHYPNWISL